MEGGERGRCPDEICARTELRFLREGSNLVEPRAVVESELRCQLPLVLQVDAIELTSLASLIGDREGHVAGRHNDAVRIDAAIVGWKHGGDDLRRRMLILEEHPEAQCVT